MGSVKSARDYVTRKKKKVAGKRAEDFEEQLTVKELAFLEEYLRSFDQSKASKFAGYDYKTQQGHFTNGAQVLKRDSVALAIAARLKAQHMGADEVLTRLAEQARGDYSKYLRANGTVDLASLLRDGKGHLIKKIVPTKYGLSIEFYDMQYAQQLIGKTHRLFVDKVDQVSEVTLKVEYGELEEDPDEDPDEDGA